MAYRDLDKRRKTKRAEYYRNREKRLEQARKWYAADPVKFRERQIHYKSVKKAMES